MLFEEIVSSRVDVVTVDRSRLSSNGIETAGIDVLKIELRGLSKS